MFLLAISATSIGLSLSIYRWKVLPELNIHINKYLNNTLLSLSPKKMKGCTFVSRNLPSPKFLQMKVLFLGVEKTKTEEKKTLRILLFSGHFAHGQLSFTRTDGIHKCERGEPKVREKERSLFGVTANKTAILKESKFLNVVAEHNR